MVRIAYNTKYDAQTGEVIFITDCPYLFSGKVGSNDCIRCKDFRAITMKQMVECGHPVEGTTNALEGNSSPRPYNLSSGHGKPIQTEIQFK